LGYALSNCLGLFNTTRPHERIFTLQLGLKAEVMKSGSLELTVTVQIK